MLTSAEEHRKHKGRLSNSGINWLISLIINLVILLAVFATTEVAYETNDDFAISRELSAGYPYVGFVNYYLCKVIISIQNIFPSVNIFVIAQIVMSFLSLTLLLKVFLDRKQSFFEAIPAAALCLLFSMDHYGSVQFTKTAALLMVAGLILAVDTYCHGRELPRFIVSFFFFYLGVSFREKGMFPALSYAGGFMLIWWIMHGRDIFRPKMRLKETGLVLLILVLLITPYGIDKLSDNMNISTPELKLSREYQAERRQITDYHVMNHYTEHKNEYDEVGLSENDIYMVDRWIFDYDGSASLENLKTINRINSSENVSKTTIIKATKKAIKNAVLSLFDLDFTGMHVAIALLLALYIIINNRPHAIPYVIVVGLFTLTIYAAIYYLQRPQYRALYVADVSAAFWLMYISVISDRRNIPRIRAISAVVLLCATLYFAPSAVQRINALGEYNKSQVISEDVINYFADHPQYFFIGPTTSMGMSPAFATPLEKAASIDNMSDTGGWDTMTPYRLEFLQNGGIHNPVKDLINSPNALYFSDGKIKTLTEYYTKWYCSEGETVHFEKIDEVDGNGIYRVIKQ